MIILISIGAFISTFLGGIFALRFKDKLHLILGFSAGAVIGVAFFDLIPEAIELAEHVTDISSITALVALGFVAYMILDRFIIMHGHTHHDVHEHDESRACAHHRRGILGAGSLAVH